MHLKKVVVLLALCTLVLTLGGQVQKTPLLFYHENFETAQLAQLRQDYDFADIARGAKTEWEQILRVKNWVFTHVPFRHNYPMAGLLDTSQLLDLAQRGTGFHCVHFATIFMQCALSMGWSARYIFAQNIEADLHATNEIWSNDFRKWILIDVTWNIHFEKDGLPLSGLEVRNEWLKNNGRDLVYVFGDKNNEARYTASDLPIKRTDSRAWVLWPIDEVFMTYTYEMAFVGRNDFFSSGDGEGSTIYDIIYIIKDSTNQDDTYWDFRFREAVTDMHALYHDLNRTDITFARADRKTFLISLNASGDYNFTPNFKEFEVNINNQGWQTSEPSFFANMPAKENRIQARVVNKFGVLGPVSQIVITN